ncbi:MAG: tetratricopeptide repeat protein [Candidatus Rokubacteria bacterium]|nr:tetratricopeptide repeat protein [Candidatus Rokubacteria bacterium]MBI2555087.1 tetratricopeptide repeat protein [Candidatus Rokubacteria bacterium]
MRGRKAWVGVLILAAALVGPAESGAAPTARSLLILPYQPVDLDREEQWLADGVAHLLALALANHPTFVLVDPVRVKRLGQPETWGEEVILGTARRVRADLAFYGEIKRVSGDLILLARYMELKGASVETRALPPLTIPEAKVPEGLGGLPLAYVKALRVAVTEGEAARIERSAVPTKSARAFEAYVKGRSAGLLGTQAGNEAAVDLLAKAVEVDPSFVAAQYALGLAHLALGNRWKAAAQFRASTQLDPAFPEPYKALGDLFLAAPRRLFDQAVEAYQRALELRPFYADAYVGLGDARAAKGEVDAAIASYQKALLYNPANPKVHLSLGKIYHAEKGLYYESVGSYKKAIELDPQFLDARMGLGEVYEDKGLYEDAIREYRKVVELDPQHTGGLYNLALVYERVDPREAIAHWERYIQVAAPLPSEKDWVDVARQHLKKLKTRVEGNR